MNDIRVLDLDEIRQLVGWAGEEGWNPGHGDAVPFQVADPDGFFGLFVDGRMVSAISAVAYDDAFGFIGLYITRPDMRGKGYGAKVWDHGMAYLGNRTIGLDGVPEQQENYGRMGFVTDYGTARWSGMVKPGCLAEASASRSFETDDFDAVVQLDRDCFMASRRDFLRAWLAQAQSARVVVTDGRLVGFGTARRCIDGYKVGPLFARSPDIACSLLGGIADDLAGSRIDIDCPLSQTRFIAALETAGLSRGFETARMFRGAVPVIDGGCVFGVTSLELG
ncbi:GNAT family N-acetyltransferase [Martelella alba]|uniref:GNAT family N-acetyltransferase n=1 Tax=Martelella alba TaxID=2590451 RepID=A0A506UJ66_9HYPH|nr:GNAT family N-acetyltransferase [Martelella alba]TPW33348.1 GNAT family N-acetyltransferase [Martelella alba]